MAPGPDGIPPDHSATAPAAPAHESPPGPLVAVQCALGQFTALTGKLAEAVTGVRGIEGGGWSVLVDVVELARIPDSTSVLATYRVDLDAAGTLQSFERLRRYHRGATDAT